MSIRPHGIQLIYGRLAGGEDTVSVSIDDGRVQEVVAVANRETPYVICPGWLDIQVNGFGGHDINTPGVSAETVSALARVLWAEGVTGFCPTICTRSEDEMVAAMRAIADACDSDPLVDASILGIHVEGPHLSPVDGPRGAHPLDQIRPPDIGEYERWQRAAKGRIRIVTLSPEYSEAPAYIRTIVSDGVVASIGHTAATRAEILAAVDAGARLSTHLGNGAHQLLPRHPNYLWDQLADDRLTASLVFDGHHLPPEVMKVFVRAKGPGRILLVTDAVSLAGAPPGRYVSSIGGSVELDDSGRLSLAGTSFLAGSVTTLATSATNALRHTEATLEEALAMVSTVPSRLLRSPLDDGRSTVSPGARANLTVIRHDRATSAIDVVATFVNGQLVHDAGLGLTE